MGDIGVWASITAAMLAALAILIPIWTRPPCGFKFQPVTEVSSDGPPQYEVRFSLIGGTVAYEPLVNISGPEYQIYGHPAKMDADSEPIRVLLSLEPGELLSATVEVRWVASTRRRPLVKGARFLLPEMKMQEWKRSKLLPWRHRWVTISREPTPYPRPLPGERRPKK